ncbi:GDP-L-fucose synthase family protein [Prochlorococcus marinus]|uniref:GDP-L-fucose synthase family protein n=1 Tax=Prochlorococcus marinus TaxID=1219 RepID=UPI001ADA3954|nr:GDP-L-fucose synthase [Prochlorococcus marinus]MBO8219518.1 GDP-L-fucose synthase [Prochlorococcus marinus CUG1416]MBW3051889.1 GDP-fucose synthetase [Prochlorococcus marinus str. MU1416]
MTNTSQKRIFIAGHNGMVGSAILKVLKKSKNIIILTRTRKELDLTNQDSVRKFFHYEKPNEVYIAAAKVGGIFANNTYPAEFITENLLIQTNIIQTAFNFGIKKLLFLGSSCIYPKLCDQPISEKDLLNGFLEKTNEPYAIAKIAGIKVCESYNRQYSESHGIDYRSIMPTNLYGPGDNYHEKNSHVIPALIRRIHDAKIKNLEKVEIWGTGSPKREFLHVDDLAEACLHIMNLDKSKINKFIDPMCSHINVGTGLDITIKDLAFKIAKIINYKGLIEFDSSKPDGSPRKLLNTSLINNLGWHPKIELNIGLEKTYQDYLDNYYLEK